MNWYITNWNQQNSNSNFWTLTRLQLHFVLASNRLLTFFALSPKRSVAIGYIHLAMVVVSEFVRSTERLPASQEPLLPISFQPVKTCPAPKFRQRKCKSIFLLYSNGAEIIFDQLESFFFLCSIINESFQF